MSLRVLLGHNAYVHRGGEEVVVENEARALQEAGIDVQIFQPRNTSGLRTSLRAVEAPLGGGTEAELEQRLADLRPHILHTHNLFPQLSPRIYAAAKKLQIKTVQTFHNFRPLCLNGLFMTPDKEVCERCAGGNFLHGIIRGCYRESRVQSIGMAAHLTAAKVGHWYDYADRYVASSRFLRDKLIKGGLPADKFVVQGNFLAEFPDYQDVTPEPYVIFLGRLSEEKGVHWLLDTFTQPKPRVKLQIAGSGPLQEMVTQRQNDFIHYLGFISEAEKDRRLRQALALVLPSDCYENYPMVVVEANARGIPVIVPGHGGMAEMVQPGTNGLQYAARDTVSFWQAIDKLLNSRDIQAERQRCRTHAEIYFSKSAFLKTRMALYGSLGGHIS